MENEKERMLLYEYEPWNIWHNSKKKEVLRPFEFEYVCEKNTGWGVLLV